MDKKYIIWRCNYCKDSFESLEKDLEDDTFNHWCDHKDENIEITNN